VLRGGLSRDPNDSEAASTHREPEPGREQMVVFAEVLVQVRSAPAVGATAIPNATVAIPTSGSA